MGEVILSSSVKERIRLATENIQCVYGGLVELENCAWITDLVEVSVRSTDDEYLAHHAKAWASGFRWPPEVSRNQGFEEASRMWRRPGSVGREDPRIECGWTTVL